MQGPNAQETMPGHSSSRRRAADVAAISLINTELFALDLSTFTWTALPAPSGNSSTAPPAVALSAFTALDPAEGGGGAVLYAFGGTTGIQFQNMNPAIGKPAGAPTHALAWKAPPERVSN